MKTRSHGFTLVELMVVVALLGIVAAIAIPTIRSATRNASVSSAGFELQLQLQGLKTRAMNDQTQLLAVLVDAPGNDGTGCVFGTAGSCTTLFVLRNPTDLWTLAAFDPAAPATNAEFVDSKTFGKGIRFATERLGRTAPRPFDAVTVFAPTHTGACAGRGCLAIRYSPSGVVSGEMPAVVPGNFRGVAFALGSDLVATTATAESRAVLVTFPSGIVKSFSL